MTPVAAHDPHYAADLHTSPALILQLEFAEIADLEQDAAASRLLCRRLRMTTYCRVSHGAGREPSRDADAPLSGGGAAAPQIGEGAAELHGRI